MSARRSSLLSRENSCSSVGWLSILFRTTPLSFVDVICLTVLSDIRCTVSSSRYIPSGVWMNSVGVTLVW